MIIGGKRLKTRWRFSRLPMLETLATFVDAGRENGTGVLRHLHPNRLPFYELRNLMSMTRLSAAG